MAHRSAFRTGSLPNLTPLAATVLLTFSNGRFPVAVCSWLGPLHIGSRSTTPLLRDPPEVCRGSQHAGANVDFGDEGAVDWAFLGNLQQLRALLLG